MTFKNTFIKFLVKTTYYPKTTLIVLLLFVGVGFYLSQKLHIDTSVTSVIVKENPDYIFFKNWQKEFGTDEYIIIVFKDENTVFQPKILEIIKKATENIQLLPYVRDVKSLANTVAVRSQGDDLIVEPLYEAPPKDPLLLKSLEKQALNDPFFRNNLISKDAKTTAIYVEIEDIPGEDVYRQETIEKICKILTNLGIKNFHLTGKTVRDYYMALYMKKDLEKFMPIALCVIVIVLFLLFRSFLGIIFSLIVVFSSLLWASSSLYLIKGTMNNVTTILPPIIIGLSISDTIHFLSEYFQKTPQLNSEFAVRDTIVKLVTPCFLTTFTTIVGFISLYSSEIPAIRQLGLSAAIGIGLAFLLTFLFIPNLLILKPLYNTPKKEKKFLIVRKSLLKLTEFTTSKPKLILVASIILMGLCLISIYNIKVETNLMKFFKKDTPIYKDTIFVEKNISGVQILEVSIKTKIEDKFKHPEILKKVDILEKEIKKIPKVDKVLSITDLIKKTNQAFHNNDPTYFRLPSRKDVISQYCLLYSREDIKNFVNSQFNWVSVQVRLSEHSSMKIRKIIKRIKSLLKEYFSDFETNVTGNPVLEADIIDSMVKSQVNSLALAMVIITLIMFLVFRSFFMGVISIIPNIFPIILNFGIMGVLGISLSTATSMISAVAIGIVVDDTIHFLHGYKKSIKNGMSPKEAIFETIRNKGEAILFTSVILAFGFGVVMFSNFSPTINFGLLTAIIMFTALVGDLVILPALLLTLKTKFLKQ